MATQRFGAISPGRLNNEAASAPAVTDDVNSGYLIGSVWIDTAADNAYTCVDNTAGAAVWKSGGSDAGAVHGACYGNEIAWTQTSAAQNTWYTISDTDISDGALSEVTHDGSGKLTVPDGGDYYIAYSLTLECSQANKHLEASIAIDGTEQSAGQCHIEINAANVEFVMANSTILTLTANQTVELSIRTDDTGSPNLTVDDFNLSVKLVGVAGTTTGAPTSADYLVKTANASLSAERVVTDTTSVTWDWATAGQAKAGVSASWLIGLLYPVGAVYISTLSTNPGTLFGVGTWATFGAGKTLVGLDSGDTDFDTSEETGGAKTVTSTGTVGNESAHTHSVTSNVTVDDHASHTHTYTEVPNHVHVQNMPSGFTGSQAYLATDTSTTGSTASAISTANPTGGVATGTTAGPSATLTHSVTNNAVTSGAGSSHTHTYTGNATSVVQPYIVVYMWKRTA